MTKDEFREVIDKLPVDICDSCFFVGSPKCPRGKEWRYSQGRIDNRMLHNDDCTQYIYWREKYRFLGSGKAVNEAYGEKILLEDEAEQGYPQAEGLGYPQAEQIVEKNIETGEVTIIPTGITKEQLGMENDDD